MLDYPLDHRGRWNPGGVPRVNWNHPLSQNLAFLWIANGLYGGDLVSGRVGALGTTTTSVANQNGPSLLLGASSNAGFGYSALNYITTSDGAGGGDFTIADLSNPVSGTRAWHITQSNSSGPKLTWLASNSDLTGGQVNGDFAFSTYGGSFVGALATGAVDGNYHAWMGVRSGTNHILYKDGASIASATGTVQNILGASANVNLLLGHDPFSIGGALCNIDIVAIWNRALSVQEARYWSNNPFSLLIFPEDDIKDLLVGAAALVSTLSDSITSSDTLSSTLGLPITLSDTIASSETLSTLLSASNTLSDTVAISDLFSPSDNVMETLSDTAISSDALVIRFGFSETLSDMLTSGDIFIGKSPTDLNDLVVSLDMYIGFVPPLPPFPIPVFPTLPPLAWSVHKKPIMSSRQSIAITGRESQVATAVYPRWAFTLTYGGSSWLRDQTQNSQIYTLLAGFTEFEQLSALFLKVQGAALEFYYEDPDDNSRSNQAVGIGDGVTTTYPLYFSWGSGPFTPSFTMPVGGIKAINQVYGNGTPINLLGFTYVLDVTKTKLIFNAPITNGMIITADFFFFFRCRFLDDHMNFSQWAVNLWENTEVRFESVKP